MIIHNLPTPDPDYSPLKNAARLAVFARAAYKSANLAREFVSESARRLDWTLAFWETENAAGLLVVYGDEANRQAIVGVAGTDDRFDLRNNLDVCPTRLGIFCRDAGFPEPKCPLAQAHTGFLVHAGLVTRKLQQLEPRLDQCRQVWLVGHSLGGAAASLVPYLWPELAPRVVTYGAPRVLARGSVEMSFPYTRVVHIHDLVVEVPRLWYRHPQSDCRVIRYCGSVASRITWPERAYRAMRLVWHWRDWYSASRAKHVMAEYERGLRHAK